MKSRAFTLIELLVVISIVGLLSSIVLAQLNSAREKGRIAAGKQFDANVYHAAADSALGIWDFDECSDSTANDRSGNANTASFGTGASWWSDSPFGSGCSIALNGTSNGYIQINQPIVSASPFTISLWFYPDRINVSYDMLYSGTDNQDVQLFFNTPGSKLRTSIENVEYNTNFTLTGSAINKWHHVVWTYDYVRRKVYLDGALVGDVADTTALNINDANVHLGSTLSNTNPFQGKIDGVRIYAKTLTASEVGALYAAQLPQFKVVLK